MYLNGVSTRRVAKVTQELCGPEISSTQVSRMTKELDIEFEAFRNRPLGCFPYVTFDALYLKVRREATVCDQAVLVACGVNPNGQREVLGASVSLSEAEVHWRSFFEDLQKRGLSGVRLITSDDHSGLKKALSAVFTNTPWQRCQFHLSQNAQSYVPKKQIREEITEAMRSIFSCRPKNIAESMFKAVSLQYEKSAP